MGKVLYHPEVRERMGAWILERLVVEERKRIVLACKGALVLQVKSHRWQLSEIRSFCETPKGVRLLVSLSMSQSLLDQDKVWDPEKACLFISPVQIFLQTQISSIKGFAKRYSYVQALRIAISKYAKEVYLGEKYFWFPLPSFLSIFWGNIALMFS